MTTVSKKQDAMTTVQDEEEYDAHRPYLDYYFSDSEMEFAFQMILGTLTMGGAEIGEAFYVANQIEKRKYNSDGSTTLVRKGTPERWQDEWMKMAIRKEARATEAAKGGHSISARIELLKASNYYRAALISMLPDTNPKFPVAAQKMRSCFKKAAEFFNPPIQYVEIPYKQSGTSAKETVLPGYFMQPNDSNEKRKTLIMLGGGETVAEDMYFFIAPAAIERGYNFLTVDLPGQGLLPQEGYYFKADTENQMKPVLDWLCAQPSVDTERIAAFGISNGGYFVPRTAAYDKRIKAAITSNAIINNYTMFQQMPFASATKEEIAAWPEFKYNVTSAVAWRWGTDIEGQVEATKDFQFDAKNVECPFLDLVASSEYSGETETQQKICMTELPNKNTKMVLSPENEGASGHCVGENRTVVSQIVFDWLDSVFLIAN